MECYLINTNVAQLEKTVFTRQNAVTVSINFKSSVMVSDMASRS